MICDRSTVLLALLSTCSSLILGVSKTPGLEPAIAHSSTKFEVKNTLGLTRRGLAVATPESLLPTNKAKPDAGKPQSEFNAQAWLLPSTIATLAIAGGGIFFLVERFGKSKKATDSKSLPEDDQTLEWKHQTNGHNPESVTLSRTDRSETQPNGKTPADNLPVKQTARLTKIDSVEASIADLQHPDPLHRRKAIWELAQQGDSRAVQPLVDLMIDSDSQQRSLILEALSQIGSKALKPINRALAVSLQDDNAQVRKNAIRDLTRIYELVAQTSQMLCHAADDPDPEVRETARWALDQLSRIRTPVTLDKFPPSQGTLNFSETRDREPPQ